VINESYHWQDLKRAVGFAAGCARLTLEHYSGEHREDLVSAIQIAERYAAGKEIDQHAAYAAASHAAAAGHAAITRAADAAADAADAAAIGVTDAARAAAYTRAAARAAADAGVDQDEIDALWRDAVAQDLGATPGSDGYFAACAALAIGNVDLARDLASGERSHAGDTP